MTSYDYGTHYYSPSSATSTNSSIASSSYVDSMCSTPDQYDSKTNRPTQPYSVINNQKSDRAKTNELDNSMASNEDENHNLNLDKSNRFFSDTVVEVLNRWFIENQSYPYPNELTTQNLAQQTNMSSKQVRKWFANKRVRSNKCMKQSYRNKDGKFNKVCIKIKFVSKNY